MQISEGQKDKIKKSFESNSKSITIRIKFSDLHGEDVIALVKAEFDRLVEAYEEKKCMTIRRSPPPLKEPPPDITMEIDETDGKDGHIYRLKKLKKYRKY